MRTILLIAAGVWLGREVFSKQADKRIKEHNLLLSKRLEEFMHKHLPELKAKQIKREIKNILSEITNDKRKWD